MKQEADDISCKLMHILQMQRRGPEKTTQRTGKSRRGTSTVIPFTSLWGTSVEAALPLSLQWLLCPAQLAITPSIALCVCCTGSRLEANSLCGMQGPALGLDQSALQWFLLFRVCVFPEKLLVSRLPTHTHTCILNVNLCESCILAWSQSNHWIWGSELCNIPK